ncbi:MAG: hypothetical protein JXB40_04035 [Candidatus Omnitrophica bacterium]|nr:hypothetical protein [Candidatus Omnitrophota bacterium]
MKVLIWIKHSPERRYLVDLHSRELVEEIRELLEKKNHSRAIVTALARGKFEREVFDHDLKGVKAGLILSEHNVRWDMTGGTKG